MVEDGSYIETPSAGGTCSKVNNFSADECVVDTASVMGEPVRTWVNERSTVDDYLSGISSTDRGAEGRSNGMIRVE